MGATGRVTTGPGNPTKNLDFAHGYLTGHHRLQHGSPPARWPAGTGLHLDGQGGARWSRYGRCGCGSQGKVNCPALASLPLLPVLRRRWDTVDGDGLRINGHLAGRHFHGSLARGRRIGD